MKLMEWKRVESPWFVLWGAGCDEGQFVIMRDDDDRYTATFKTHPADRLQIVLGPDESVESFNEAVAACDRFRSGLTTEGKSVN